MKRTIDECFFHIQNGANIKQGQIDGGFPITRIETISNNTFNRDRMGYAGITDVSKYKSYVLEDGDLLMSHINSAQYLGRTVLYEKRNDETIIHGMNLLRLKARSNIILPSFARYCFYGRIFKSQIATITKKSVNQASFAVKDLKQIQIDVPPIVEQNKIVHRLDTISHLIERENIQLAKLDTLVKSRFIEMFGDPNEMDKWPCRNVEDIADVTVGLVIKPTRFYTGDTENGVKAFRSLNVREMRVNDSDWVYFSPEGNEQNKKSQLQKGDVLVVRSGYPGTSCVVTDEYVGCNAIDVIIARPKQDKINPYYLCAFNNFPHGMNQIRHGTGGAAQKHFNVGAYNKVTVPVPPIEEQNKFVEFMQQVDKSKSVLQKLLEKQELLRAALMQEYFG